MVSSMTGRCMLEAGAPVARGPSWLCLPPPMCHRPGSGAWGAHSRTLTVSNAGKRISYVGIFTWTVYVLYVRTKGRRLVSVRPSSTCCRHRALQELCPSLGVPTAWPRMGHCQPLPCSGPPPSLGPRGHLPKGLFPLRSVLLTVATWSVNRATPLLYPKSCSDRTAPGNVRDSQGESGHTRRRFVGLGGGGAVLCCFSLRSITIITSSGRGSEKVLLSPLSRLGRSSARCLSCQGSDHTRV